jgi:DNA-binding response OmpR family regulator
MERRPPSSPTILVVDDEANIVELVRLYLRSEGYQVESACDGREALEKIATLHPSLVVLDLMMPEVDGWEVTRRLRETGGRTPIIMLTAKGDDADKIVGLDMGADDYLAKPFNPRELLARIRAILRRATAPAPGSERRLRVRGIEIDLEAREVVAGGRRVSLTSYEFELLALLARTAGRVLSREQILDALKGQDYESFDRSIDVHISKLRAKLEQNPKEPRLIKTVRGVGYVLLRNGTDG